MSFPTYLHPSSSVRHRRATSPSPSPSLSPHIYKTDSISDVSTIDIHAEKQQQQKKNSRIPSPTPKTHSLPTRLLRKMTQTGKTHSLNLNLNNINLKFSPTMQRLTSRLTLYKPLPTSLPFLLPLGQSRKRALLTLPLTPLPVQIPYTYTSKQFKLGPADVADIAGFTGLGLAGLTLSASLPLTAKSTFDLSCQLGEGVLELSGTLSTVAGFQASGVVPKGWTLQDVARVYSQATGKTLAPLPDGVEAGEMVVEVDSRQGVVFHGAVTVHGCTSVSATLALQRDGLVLSAELEDLEISGGVVVKRVAAEGFIGRLVPGTTGRESGVKVTGVVTWSSHEVEVVVEAIAGGGWSVYGALSSEKGMTLSRIVPSAKRTWLDLELHRAVFIATSDDGVVQGYAVSKGIQFCAALSRPIEQIGHVTGARVDGLQLRCAWEQERGAFRIAVVMPTEVGMRLARNVTSGPLSVGLVLGSDPAVEFRAAMNVHPSRQERPLVFEVIMSAGLIKASGSGEMRGWWESPFGLERVKVGPRLALQVDVTYATVAVAGPGVAFDSGMAVGEVEASVAVAVSQNPKDELVQAKLNHLSAADLTRFAGNLCGTEIPAPAEDLLECRDVLIYLSGGRSIGSVYYPAGASMSGELTLFGQKASLAATVGAVTSLAAKLPNLELGPLTLGATDANVELGVSRQHVALSSSVTLMGCTAAVAASMTILPEPGLTLSLSLTLGPALHLALDAAIIGPVSFTSLAGCDFTIHAVLEQHIISFLLHQLRTIFRAARKMLHAGIDAAHELIHAAASTLEHAHDALHAAKVAWQDHESSLKAAFHALSEEFEETFHSLHSSVASAEHEAEAKAQQVRADHAAALLAAKERLDERRQTHAKEVTGKLEEIRKLKEVTNREFGASAAQRAAAALEEQRRAEEAAESVPVGGCCGLRGYRQRRRAARVVEVAKVRAVEAARKVNDGSYVAARQGKSELKASLLALREAEKAEVEAAASTVAEVESTTIVIPDAVAAAVEEKKRALEEFSVARSPVLQEMKTKVEMLAESDEKKLVEKAEAELQLAAAQVVDVDAAKQALSLTKTEERHAAVLPKEQDDEDENLWFDIERIELDGSLRGLVEGGDGVMLKMAVVVKGQKKEVSVNWGVGGAASLVSAVWGGVWDILTGDDDETPIEDSERVTEV